LAAMISTEERNGYFAAIVQYSDDAIISKTLDGYITSWNNAAERIFGYTAADVIGKHITIIVPPERLEEEYQIQERLKKGERIDHFETKRITKDKKILDIALTVSPVKDSSGRIIGASKIARDITSQIKAEQRIRESEERLRLATEAAELGLWDLDLTTGISITSPQHRKIIGYSKDEVWSFKRYLQVVHPDDKAIVEMAYEKSLYTGKMAFEVRIIRADGAERWTRVNGTVIYDKKNVPVRLIGTILDITEQREVKYDLEKMVTERTQELVHTNQ